jgi:HEAT repeat protein
MRSRQWAVFYAGVLVALTSGAADKEPVYQGRTLTQWTRDIDPHYAVAVGHEPPEWIAIRTMGSNAIPTLLKWMAQKDPPEPQKPNLAPCYTVVRSERAVLAFHILGEAAGPAIPELTRLAITTRDPERADRCINALAAIGPESLPSFIEILTNGTYRARFSALEWFPALHVDNTPAMAGMINCLTHKNENLGFRAAQTLSESAIPEPILVPALTNALTTASPGGRARIYRCLCWLRVPARAAAPAIRAGLSDRNGEVRTNATYAAQRIAPELLKGSATLK